MSQSSPSYSPRLTRAHTRSSLLAIVLAAGTLIDIVLLTLYSTTSRCLCHSESCANHVTKLTTYSSRLTRSHTRRILLAATLATSYPLSFLPPAPSLTSYSSRCIVQLPAVCHSESCANHVTKLAIILVASYLLSSSPPAVCSSRRSQLVVSYLPTFLCFRAKCGSSIYRCTLDIMNRTGLSYYA